MQSVTKEQIAMAVIKHIKKSQNAIEVKTGLISSYKNPSKVIWKSNHSGYTPDIKTISAQGSSDIYEIEIANDYNVDKWQLFSLYVKKTHGNLIIVVPESRVTRISEKIRKKNLKNVQLITIPL